MLRITIGDDDATYIDAVVSLVTQEAGLCHEGSAPDVSSLIALIDRQRASVAAVDVRLPGGGIEAVAAGLRKRHACRLVATAAVVTPAARKAAARAGAVLVAKADGAHLLAALMAAEG